MGKVRLGKVGFAEVHVMSAAMLNVNAPQVQGQESGQGQVASDEGDGALNFDFWPSDFEPIDANHFGIGEGGVGKRAIQYPHDA